MYKTKILLDHNLIEENNGQIELFESILKDICEKENFIEKESNVYELKENVDSFCAGMGLFGEIERSNLIYYIKEWKIYSTEESLDGQIEEEDMLSICRRKGIL